MEHFNDYRPRRYEIDTQPAACKEYAGGAVAMIAVAAFVYLLIQFA
jgi:hypothetical protein